jgi:hypothetical protein
VQIRGISIYKMNRKKLDLISKHLSYATIYLYIVLAEIMNLSKESKETDKSNLHN